MRQKTEAAQEKQRQKVEADQEKRRQADQANIIKTIKLKIVTGGSSRNLSGFGTSSSSLISPSPMPPPSTKIQMAPSNMFFASTGPSSGLVLKKKAPGLGAHKVNNQGGYGVVKKMGPGRPPGAGRGVGRPPGPGRGLGGAPITYDAPMDMPMAWEQAPSGVASGPADFASLKKILDKIQVKDPHNIFLHPVSDAVVSQLK